MSKSKNIGKRFGQWKVVGIARVVKYKNGKVYVYNMLCDCGNEREVYAPSLYRSKPQQNCADPKTHPESGGVFKKKHGLTGSYQWRFAVVKQRCEGWKEIRLFLSEIGDKPSAKHHLVCRHENVLRCGKCNECISSNVKLNVEWTDNHIDRGHASFKTIEHNGEIHTISEWAKKLNIHRSAVYQRLDRNGYGISPVELPSGSQRKLVRGYNPRQCRPRTGRPRHALVLGAPLDSCCTDNIHCNASCLINRHKRCMRRYSRSQQTTIIVV